MTADLNTFLKTTETFPKTEVTEETFVKIIVSLLP